MVFNESMGIAINANQMTMAYMKATPLGVRLAARETVTLEPNAAQHDELKWANGEVNDFMNRHGIRTACVNIGLPADQHIMRTIELPLAAKENLRQTIAYELKKYLPLATEELFFDYHTLSENKRSKNMEIMIAAIKKSALAPLLEMEGPLVKGLCGIETAASAWINGLQWLAPPEASDYMAALIDGDACQLAMITDGHLNGVTIQHLSGDLQNRCKQILDAAHHVRSAATDSDDAITLYCLGSGATGAMLEALQHNEQWHVQLAELAPEHRGDGQLTIAVGLALKGLQPVALDINLMPTAMRKKPSRSGQFLSAILLALVLLSAGAWVGRSVFHMRHEQAQLDQQIDQLAAQVRAIEQLQSKINSLDEQINFTRLLQPEPAVNTLAILKELSRIIPASAWVRDLNIKGPQVQIDGYADDAAQLITMLDQSALFTNVAFLSSITKGRDGKERYRIGFDIQQPTVKLTKVQSTIGKNALTYNHLNPERPKGHENKNDA